MATITPIRIPVCNSDGVIVERVDAARARRIALAPNARVVRKRRNGRAIVRIMLGSVGDESLEDRRHGNPLTYSYKSETDFNPENCWTLKRIPTETADLFDTVLLELRAA